MGILRTDKISGLETPTAVTGSVSFDGNDHLSIGNAGNFNFLHNGATDWTVEFWAKTGTATRQFVWGTGGSSAQTGFYLQIMSAADAQSDATGVFALVGRGASGNYIGWGANNCLTVNTWHHIAAVFKSSDKTLALYVDGREVDNDSGTVNGTFAAGNYSSSDSTYAFTVGKNIHGNSDFMNGEISNLRVFAGRRLYTSDFTPPVHALEPINGTRILCCNNPDSVTAVSNAGIGTAHVATASGDPTVATDNPSLTRDFTSGTEFQGVTTFDTQGYFVPPSGTTEQRGRGRGLFGGGRAYPSNNTQKTIDFVEIQTQGNALDFGDLTSNRERLAGAAGAIRGLFAGGQISPTTNIIDFVTISTTGNATDFGDLTTTRMDVGGAANHTRAAFFAGGTPGNNTNIIDFVTIASIGNAQDFGDLTDESSKGCGCGSPTRGIIFIGTTVQYITWATTGNAQDFGDTTITNTSRMALSDSTRGIVAGGYASPAKSNVIEYITIATLGNAQDFGDLTYGAYEPEGALSNSTRGVLALGDALVLSETNAIDYITIQTTGNAKDFGDLTQRRKQGAGSSDSHGGIS